MNELSLSKKKKLIASLKKFHNKYLTGKYTELDESATRLMVNEFLSEILGFTSLDEIKTEYMIRGTYADYIIQMKGKRYFIVEVKAMSIELSEKHLRQAVNYAANEGIEWALLTNGRQYDFYKILFNKPIEYRQVFSVDLSKQEVLKPSVEFLQFLNKSLIAQKGLDVLWHKVSALDPSNLSRLLYGKPVLNYLKRELKRLYKHKFNNENIIAALTRIVEEEVEMVKAVRQQRKRRHKKIKIDEKAAVASPLEVVVQ